MKYWDVENGEPVKISGRGRREPATFAAVAAAACPVGLGIEAARAATAKAEALGGVLVRVGGEYLTLVFAEKPPRAVIDALKDAGFHWTGTGWSGRLADLPSCPHRDARHLWQAIAEQLRPLLPDAPWDGQGMMEF